MQNVIQRVMEAEGEAQRILQDARTEAERLVDEARQQVKVKESQSRINVRLMADTLIEKAVQAAENEKAAQLARAVLAMNSGTHLDDPVRRCAVKAVVDCVAGKNQSG